MEYVLPSDMLLVASGRQVSLAAAAAEAALILAAESGCRGCTVPNSSVLTRVNAGLVVANFTSAVGVREESGAKVAHATQRP